MALKIAPTTHRTCSGVFLRMDEGFGLLAHSPYTGLTYAIDPLDADGISQWLNNNSSEPPANHYKYSLGAGWAVPLEKSRQHVPQLLPTRRSLVAHLQGGALKGKLCRLYEASWGGNRQGKKGGRQEGARTLRLCL